jgi:hypothetical protein
MEQFSIGLDFEGAAPGRNKRERFDTVAEFENFGRQTDGFGRVVSDHAVFNRHVGVHLMLLSNATLSGPQNPVKARCGGAVAPGRQSDGSSRDETVAGSKMACVISDGAQRRGYSRKSRLTIAS